VRVHRCMSVKRVIKRYSRVWGLLACIMGLVVTSLGGDEAVRVRLCPYYSRYTVPGGEKALAILWILGYGSVEEYQQAKGLKADGVVGPETWRAIMEDISVKGIEIKGENASAPFSLGVELVGGEIRFTVSNCTSKTAIFMGASSFDESRQSNVGASFLITGSVSGRKPGGLTYRAGYRVHAIWNEPLKLPAQGCVVKAFKLHEEGEGSTEFACRALCVVNESTVMVVASSPVVANRALRIEGCKP